MAAQQLGSRSTQCALDSFHKTGTAEAFTGVNAVLELINARGERSRYTGAREAPMRRRPARELLRSVSEDAPHHPLVEGYHALCGLKPRAGGYFLFEAASPRHAARLRDAVRAGVSDADCVAARRWVLVRALHGRKDAEAQRAERARLRARVESLVVGDFDDCGEEPGGGWWGAGGAPIDALRLGAEVRNPVDALRAFGVGAAHASLHKELALMFPGCGPHTRVVAAAMCRAGSIHGARREGMKGMGASPMQLMCFENVKHGVVSAVLDRGTYATSGPEADPSSSVMMGALPYLGTGSVHLREDEQTRVDALLARCPRARFVAKPPPEKRYMPHEPPPPPKRRRPPPPPPAPIVWKRVEDEGEVFWVHSITGEVAFDDPDAPPPPAEWTRMEDEGEVFWVHATGEVVFDDPHAPPPTTAFDLDLEPEELETPPPLPILVA